MIKGRSGETMIVGLSDINIEELKKGHPIKFNMKDLGFPPITVVIFTGKDEQTMLEMFEKEVGVRIGTKINKGTHGG